MPPIELNDAGTVEGNAPTQAEQLPSAENVDISNAIAENLKRFEGIFMTMLKDFYEQQEEEDQPSDTNDLGSEIWNSIRDQAKEFLKVKALKISPANVYQVMYCLFSPHRRSKGSSTKLNTEFQHRAARTSVRKECKSRYLSTSGVGTKQALETEFNELLRSEQEIATPRSISQTTRDRPTSFAETKSTKEVEVHSYQDRLTNPPSFQPQGERIPADEKEFNDSLSEYFQTLYGPSGYPLPLEDRDASGAKLYDSMNSEGGSLSPKGVSTFQGTKRSHSEEAESARKRPSSPNSFDSAK